MKIVNHLFYLISLLVVSPAFGQEKEINLRSLSLEEAVNYSLNNSPKLTVQRLKEQQAEYKLSQTKLDYLPTIYVSSGVQRNIVIPSTPIPASMINPQAAEDELLYMKFNTPWNSSVGLNLTFDLFNPQTIGRKSEQQKELLISQFDSRIAENMRKSDVSQAYVDCVIAQEQMDVVTNDTVYHGVLFREAEKLYQREKVSRVEMNNTLINYNASLVRFHQAKKILYESKVNLLLNLGEILVEENVEELHLSDNIQSLYDKMVDSSNMETNRTPLSSLRQNELISLSEIKYKNAKLKYAPTLSFSGFYGANYYDKKLNLGNSDRWFGNSFVALSLRIPISQSLTTAKEVSQLRIQEQIERENSRDLDNNRTGELSRELSQLEACKNNYQLKLTNLKLMNENIAAMRLQLQKGYILESEFFSEQLREQKASQEYLQAAYDVLSTYINVEKLMKN